MSPPSNTAMHPAALPGEQLLAQCQVRRTRRSGPGGQHRNKVESAVVIEHLPTGVIAEANERRSQHENHTQAVFRLRVKLAIQVRRPVTSSTPSPLWQTRCRGGKLAINAAHDDFPAVLAEALDVLDAKQFDMPTAAAALGCTASQLVKLFKQESAALVHVNQRRVEAALPRLR